MDAEISRLEAALLNLNDSKQQIAEQINCQNNELAAELSREAGKVTGSKRVVVRTVPVQIIGPALTDGILFEGSGEKQDSKTIYEFDRLYSDLREKYRPAREKILKKLTSFIEEENDRQKELAKFIELTSIRPQNDSDTHAHLYAIRGEAVYTARLFFDIGLLVPDDNIYKLSAADELKNIDCLVYEVSHKSKLAFPGHMIKEASERILKEHSRVK